MTETLFTKVRIVDGGGKKPFGGQVLVKGNRIRKVAKAGKGLKAPGAQVVDGDPVKDISVLQDAGRITAVMKDGAFHKAPGGAPAAGQAAA